MSAATSKAPSCSFNVTIGSSDDVAQVPLNSYISKSKSDWE